MAVVPLEMIVRVVGCAGAERARCSG